MRPRRPGVRLGKGLGWLLPALLVLVVVTLVPIGRLVWTSLHRSTTTSDSFVGLDNYTDLITNRTWWLAVATTLVVVASVVLAQVVLGVLFGAAIHRIWPVARVVVLVPLLLLSVVNVVAWRDAASGGYLTEWFGIGSTDGSAGAQLVAVTIGEVWRGTGLVAAVVALALTAVPASLSAAAVADGATGLQRWRRVVLPSIAPALAGVTAFRVFDTYRVLDGPLLADDSSLRTAPLLTWTTQFSAFELGLGAAMSVLVLLVAVILAALVLPLIRVRRLL